MIKKMLTLVCVMGLLSSNVFGEDDLPLFKYLPLKPEMSILYHVVSAIDVIPVTDPLTGKTEGMPELGSKDYNQYEVVDVLGKVSKDHYVVAKYLVNLSSQIISRSVRFYYYHYTDDSIIEVFIKQIPSEKYDVMEFINYPGIVKEWEPEGKGIVIYKKDSKNWDHVYSHKPGDLGYYGSFYWGKGSRYWEEKNVRPWYSYRFSSTHASGTTVKLYQGNQREYDNCIVIGSGTNYGTDENGDLFKNTDHLEFLLKLQANIEGDYLEKFSGNIYHAWGKYTKPANMTDEQYKKKYGSNPYVRNRINLKSEEHIFRPGVGLVQTSMKRFFAKRKFSWLQWGAVGTTECFWEDKYFAGVQRCKKFPLYR